MYSEGFSEDVVNNKRVFYSGEELKNTINQLEAELANLNNYSYAQIYDASRFPRSDINDIEPINQEKLSYLIQSINNAKSFIPSGEVAKKIEELLKSRKYLSNEDKGIFGISLRNYTPNANGIEGLENFILYDDTLKIAWFENIFYNINLSSIID